jgi:hypothetical protein
VVASSSTLILQKFSDPDGTRSGTTAIGGFQFAITKNGVPIAGSPFTVGPNGLTIPGLDPGTYVVNELSQPRWRLTGSKTDMGNNGSFEVSVTGPATVVLPESGITARVNFYNQEMPVSAEVPQPPNTGQWTGADGGGLQILWLAVGSAVLILTVPLVVGISRRRARN